MTTRRATLGAVLIMLSSFACFAAGGARQGSTGERDLGGVLRDAIGALPASLRGSAQSYLSYEAMDALKETAEMSQFLVENGNGAAWDPRPDLVDVSNFMQRIATSKEQAGHPAVAARDIARLSAALEPFFNLPEARGAKALFDEAFGIAKRRVPSLTEDQLRREAAAFMRESGLTKVSGADLVPVERAPDVLADGTPLPPGVSSLAAARARLRKPGAVSGPSGEKRPRFESRVWEETRFPDLGDGRRVDQRQMPSERRTPIDIAAVLASREDSVSEMPALSATKAAQWLKTVSKDELPSSGLKYVLLNGAISEPLSSHDQSTVLILGPNFVNRAELLSAGPVILLGGSAEETIASSRSIVVADGSTVNALLQAPEIVMGSGVRPGARAAVLAVNFGGPPRSNPAAE